MKANYNKLVEAETDKIYKICANNVAKSVIAAALLVLHRRKWHADKIEQFYNDVIDVLHQPPVFGKYMTDEEVRQFIAEKYGIDFNKVKLNLETDTETRIRRREERNEKK